MKEQREKKTKNSSDDNRIPDDEPKSFLEHLDELRATIIWSAGVYIAAVIAACFFAPRIIAFLQGPLKSIDNIDPDKFIISIDVSEPFMIWMKVAIWSGLLLALPLIIFIIGSFVIPGLTIRERRVVKGALASAAGLFFVGTWMCYRFTLPVALNVMLWIPGKLGLSVPGWTLGSYTVFVLRLLVAFGLAFELPVVVYSLGSLGIISSKQMQEKRNHVIVGLMVLAMILTPQDPWTMLMMAIPLILLYEACIWMVKIKEIRKASSGEETVPDGHDDDGTV